VVPPGRHLRSPSRRGCAGSCPKLEQPDDRGWTVFRHAPAKGSQRAPGGRSRRSRRGNVRRKGLIHNFPNFILFASPLKVFVSGRSTLNGTVEAASPPAGSQSGSRSTNRLQDAAFENCAYQFFPRMSSIPAGDLQGELRRQGKRMPGCLPLPASVIPARKPQDAGIFCNHRGVSLREPCIPPIPVNAA